MKPNCTGVLAILSMAKKESCNIVYGLHFSCIHGSQEFRPHSHRQTNCVSTVPPVQLFNYQVLDLVQKTVIFSPYLLPSILQTYFIPTSSIHRYETRHNKLYLTHANTRFGQLILRYKGTQLWNRLPNNLSNNTASQSFRNMLKLLLFCDPM